MFDVTAGRSAGTPANPELDPTRPVPPVPDRAEPPVEEVRDVTAGSSAGTRWNAAQDPTRPAA